MDNKSLLCSLTKKLWNAYMIDPSEEHYGKLFEILAEDSVIIGTDRSEFYVGFSQAVDALSSELGDSEARRYDIIEENYSCDELSAEVYVVYGKLWIRQRPTVRAEVTEDLDTRFSVVFVKRGDSWVVKHVHHSAPYAIGRSEETYPRALEQKTAAALELAHSFKLKSETDLMTSVYNHDTFHAYVEDRILSDAQGVFYLFDLDFFKQCNDSYGHQCGDVVLKKFAKLLIKHFHGKALVGRTGGDEFAAYCTEKYDRSLILKEMQALEAKFAAETKKIIGKELSFSAGITFSHQGQSFSEVFSAADKSLYRAKQGGRNAVFIV